MNPSHRNSTPFPPSDRPRAWGFDHHRLDAHAVALEALVLGEQVAKNIPRGYAARSDQFR